jgi:hypothetical protein
MVYAQNPVLWNLKKLIEEIQSLEKVVNFGKPVKTYWLTVTQV